MAVDCWPLTIDCFVGSRDRADGRRVLAIDEQCFGADHPDVATSLNNLAEFYRIQGRYAEAEPLIHRALAARKQVLGDAHPDTCLTRGNLASLLEKTGRHEQADVAADQEEERLAVVQVPGRLRRRLLRQRVL